MLENVKFLRWNIYVKFFDVLSCRICWVCSRSFISANHCRCSNVFSIYLKINSLHIGENCDIQQVSRIVNERDTSTGNVPFFFMIFLAIILCGFVIFWLYHKRQVETLKQVLDHHVRYMPDSSIDGEFRWYLRTVYISTFSLQACQIKMFSFYFVDRHHFDNPVYSMGNSPMRSDSFTTKMNNAHIINNLNHKENNLDKQKLTINSTYGDDGSWTYGGE